MNYREFIEDNTLRLDAGYRGGGIEIDLSELFPYLDNPKMTAYQNYLGGGMLGKICSAYNFKRSDVEADDQQKLEDITRELQKYFHGLTNHTGDKWEETTFEENQRRPVSAY